MTLKYLKLNNKHHVNCSWFYILILFFQYVGGRVRAGKHGVHGAVYRYHCDADRDVTGLSLYVSETRQQS